MVKSNTSLQEPSKRRWKYDARQPRARATSWPAAPILLVQMKIRRQDSRGDRRREEDPRDGDRHREERQPSPSAPRTPAAVLGEHKKLRKAWPGVIEACNLIGSTQVQGRASAGGNLRNAPRRPPTACPALVARRLHRQRRRPHRQARGAGRGVLHRPRPDLAEDRRDRRQPRRCRSGRRTRRTPTCA